ncbi:MAG: hypothetical protein E7616_01390 [Ruminococcaceae bacterium]|nr:hypothetical protein [Oscillospiraceae bacterium]
MNANETMGIYYPTEDTVNLYQYIYKNAQVGMGSIGKLLEIQDCGEITEILHGQRKGYTAILRDAANALAKCGIRPTGMRGLEKLHTCMMIKCSVKNKEHSLPRITGMVILGTTIGSIEGAKKQSQCPGADDDSKALMERLLRFEEANCRSLRAFL